jgi:plastocyanin domain-containing protein
MDKVITLVGSASLIGAIIWWFFGKKELTVIEAEQHNGFQKIEIVAEGGYTPSKIALKQGVPAKFVFTRKDPSSCLEEVIFPEFGISRHLPVNKRHEIEIMPDEPGNYKFVCGMQMFSGDFVVK